MMMPIVKLDEWKRYEEQNINDPYGKACVDVARRTMELLDASSIPLTPHDTHTLICQADKEVDAGGITGFMATMVAQMIMQVHSRGDEFRIAWNADHGCSEEKAKGRLLNAAVMTIG